MDLVEDMEASEGCEKKEKIFSKDIEWGWFKALGLKNAPLHLTIQKVPLPFLDAVIKWNTTSGNAFKG